MDAIMVKCLTGVSLIIMSCLNVVVNGSTTVIVDFKHYYVNGEDYEGKGCDKWPLGDCDPKFVFCIDDLYGNNQMDSCSYFRLETNDYGNQNHVIFASKFPGDAANPIQAKIDEPYSGFKLKIDAIDDDSLNSDDRMDLIFFTYSDRPNRNASVATYKEHTQYGSRPSEPSYIIFELKLFCDANYYGASCSKYCIPQDTDRDGHYMCDLDTGEKLCRAGWKTPEEDCTVKINDCENNNKCLHEATCVDGYKSFTCSCPDHFAGPLCEYHICDVDPMFCMNSGTCVKVEDGLPPTCLCMDQFTGPNCETDMCDVKNCTNGGSCINGTCVCEGFYTGTLCEVDVCDILQCDSQTEDCVMGLCVVRSTTSNVDGIVTQKMLISEEITTGGAPLWIIAIVLMIIVIAVVVIVVVILFRKRRRNKASESDVQVNGREDPGLSQFNNPCYAGESTSTQLPNDPAPAYYDNHSTSQPPPYTPHANGAIYMEAGAISKPPLNDENRQFEAAGANGDIATCGGATGINKQKAVDNIYSIDTDYDNSAGNHYSIPATLVEKEQLSRPNMLVEENHYSRPNTIIENHYSRPNTIIENHYSRPTTMVENHYEDLASVTSNATRARKTESIYDTPKVKSQPGSPCVPPTPTRPTLDGLIYLSPRELGDGMGGSNVKSVENVNNKDINETGQSEIDARNTSQRRADSYVSFNGVQQISGQDDLDSITADHTTADEVNDQRNSDGSNLTTEL